MLRIDLPEKYKKFLTFGLFLLTAMLTYVPHSLAHNVFLSTHIEGDKVFVEGGFSDGTLCNHAKIKVFDLSGNKLLEGKTDENGVFSFSPPQKMDLKVVLDAGMGHRDEYTIGADELPDVTDTPATRQEAIPSHATESHRPQASNSAIPMTAEEVEIIVDKVIQKRLHPLTQLVAKSQRHTRVSATELFGGIGYILGLMGIAMYFKFRRG